MMEPWSESRNSKSPPEQFCPLSGVLTELRLSRTICSMKYTWDPDKDALNRQNHKMGLEEGIPALEDPDAVEFIDDRMNYDEERWVTYGRNRHGMVLAVVWTERGPDWNHLISVWKANRNEQKKYYRGQP
jgi:uncharacterized protein